MPADLAQALGIQARYTGDNLDKFLSVLNNTLVDTGFCCMLKLLANLDPKFLKIMQAIIRLSLNRFSLQFQSLDSVLSNLWTQIQHLILSAVLSLLYNVLAEIQSQVKPFFAGLTPGSCISWNLLAQTMLQYIGKIENSVLDLILEMNNSQRLQNSYITQYSTQLGKSQNLRLLNSLIDILLNARTSGTFCSPNGVPTDSELATVFNQFIGLVGFEALSPTTITVQTQPGSNGSRNTTNVSNQFDDCLKKVPPEEVQRVQAWINTLKSQGK
jgi:hypothetical protein